MLTEKIMLVFFLNKTKTEINKKIIQIYIFIKEMI